MRRYALLGNPNTGKSTVFSRLCGIRVKTANFPGSTVEARLGTAEIGGRPAEVVDLPGLYGLNLELPESRLCKDYLAGTLETTPAPDALVIIADATNLSRNLMLVSQALQQGLPAVVALNMIDLAQRRGLSIDAEKLSADLGCAVVPICARSGEGIDALVRAMDQPAVTTAALPDATNATAAARWADAVVAQSVGGHDAVGEAGDTITDRLDAAFTHPLLGLLVFIAVMT
ncbi:MAG: FeoB small GTPase domain-containing protein, partial [Planctomycetota bacterium]